MATSNTLLKLKRKKAFDLANSGNIEAALAIYQQLYYKNPRDANAAFMLGALYGSIDNNADAARFSRLATELDNNLADAYYNLAQAEKNLSNLEASITALRRVIALIPDHVEALNNLGFSLLRQNEHEEALKYLQCAIRLKPSHVESLINLGQVYMTRGEYKLAVTIYKEALNYAPDSIELKKSLAYAHYKNGDTDSAMSLYQEAVRIDKNDVEAISGMAMILEMTGRFQEALQYIEPCLQSAHQHIVALAFAKIARHFDREADAINYLEKVIETDKNTPHASLHFHLGRLYDSTKEYDKAFQHYQISNLCSTANASDNAYIDLMNASQRTFTSELYSAIPRSRVLTKRPIFIVGMPRSGTTLTEQILASHATVVGGGELSDIDIISNNLPTYLNSKKSYPECAIDLTQDVIDNLSKKYLDRLSQISATSPHITDKMPHNFLHLGLINLMFPDAPIVYCKRNSLDNCLSIYFSEFNVAHAYAANLAAVGEHYVHHERLMAHWKKLFGNRILELSYEDLVDSQEASTRTLLEFCGLEWDNNCLQFHKSKRIVNTISYDQVRRPIYKKSVARWKNYEKHIAPLAQALGIDLQN